MSKPHLTILLVCLLTGVATAQSIFTVAGTNPDFSTLAAAHASAKVKDGDTLIVRSSVQVAPDLTKALTILGDGRVTLVKPFNQAQNWRIQGIAAGKRVVVRGVSVGVLLLLSNCSGRVHIDNCSVNGALISGCRAVSMQGGSVSRQCNVRGSNISFSGMTLRSQASVAAITPALQLTQSRAWIAASNVRGPDGFRIRMSTTPPGEAIICSDSQLQVMRDAVIQAGAFSGFSRSAIRSTDRLSRLALDPRAQVIASGSARPQTGFVIVLTQRPPVVITTGGEIGKASVADVRGNRGDAYLLYGSGFGRPFSLPQFGGLVWHDLASLQLLAAGTLRAADAVQITRQIPNLAGLRGFALNIQALAGQGGGPFFFSNPAGLVVR